MTSACLWIRGYPTPWLEPSPSLRVQHGDTVGNARFVWWYKRVARPKNGGRRWKSESSWVPFGNGEFGVNIIAVWRHVNATVQSLTFTSDSTDFRLTYHSQWMHIQVNYLAYGTSLTKCGRLLQFRLFTVPYFPVRSTRSRAFIVKGGHLCFKWDYSGGKAGRGVVVVVGGGGGWEKGRDWLLSQYHCNSNLRPLSLTMGLIQDCGHGQVITSCYFYKTLS